MYILLRCLFSLGNFEHGKHQLQRIHVMLEGIPKSNQLALFHQPFYLGEGLQPIFAFVTFLLERVHTFCELVENLLTPL